MHAQPDTTLLDCILYMMEYGYDPCVLPSSAFTVSGERVSETQSSKATHHHCLADLYST